MTGLAKDAALCRLSRLEKRSSSKLAGPCLGNRSAALNVVHDKNHLMVMIAVQDLNVDARLCHAAREQAKLTGHILF
jgi:hypothetical protein